MPDEPKEISKPKERHVEIEFRVSVTVPKGLVRETLTTLVDEFACDLREQLEGSELTSVGWSQSRRARLSRRHHINRRQRRRKAEPEITTKPN